MLNGYLVLIWKSMYVLVKILLLITHTDRLQSLSKSAYWLWDCCSTQVTSKHLNSLINGPLHNLSPLCSTQCTSKNCCGPVLLTCSKVIEVNVTVWEYASEQYITSIRTEILFSHSFTYFNMWRRKYNLVHRTILILKKLESGREGAFPKYSGTWL